MKRSHFGGELCLNVQGVLIYSMPYFWATPSLILSITCSISSQLEMIFFKSYLIFLSVALWVALTFFHQSWFRAIHYSIAAAPFFGAWSFSKLSHSYSSSSALFTRDVTCSKQPWMLTGLSILRFFCLSFSQ